MSEAQDAVYLAWRSLPAPYIPANVLHDVIGLHESVKSVRQVASIGTKGRVAAHPRVCLDLAAVGCSHLCR